MNSKISIRRTNMQEHKDYPGFFYIPQFPLCVISKACTNIYTNI